MSKYTNLNGEESITRRTFLKRSLGVGLALVAVQGAGAMLTSLSGCAAPPTADIPVTSSVDFNHSHKVTIPGADVDRPPAEKTYTSDGPTHQHSIKLTKRDFETIKKGGEVSVVSDATGTTPHTHTFVIKKA